MDCEDNCPDVPNSDQADEDGDGLGDACPESGRETPGACGGGACPGASAALVGLTLFGLVRTRRTRMRTR